MFMYTSLSGKITKLKIPTSLCSDHLKKRRSDMKEKLKKKTFLLLLRNKVIYFSLKKQFYPMLFYYINHFCKHEEI